MLCWSGTLLILCTTIWYLFAEFLLHHLLFVQFKPSLACQASVISVFPFCSVLMQDLLWRHLSMFLWPCNTEPIPLRVRCIFIPLCFKHLYRETTLWAFPDKISANLESWQKSVPKNPNIDITQEMHSSTALKLQKLFVLEKLNTTVSKLVCFPLQRLKANFTSVFPYMGCLSNTCVVKFFAQSMFNMEMRVL